MFSDDEDENELECPDEQRDYIRSIERAITVGGRGYANVNGQVITKHDPELCGHKNTQKITVSRKCQAQSHQNTFRITCPYRFHAAPLTPQINQFRTEFITNSENQLIKIRNENNVKRRTKNARLPRKPLMKIREFYFKNLSISA